MRLTGATASAARSRSRGQSRQGALPRLVIVAVVVVGIAWSVAAALIHPRAFWMAALLHLAPVLLAVAALVASALDFHLRTCPPGLVVREGVGFLAPANRAFGFLLVGEVLMMAFLVDPLLTITTWTAPGSAGFGHAITGILLVAAFVASALVAALMVVALRGRPRIEFTPRRLLLAEVFGSRTIPWEALAVSPVHRVDRRALTLTVDKPELVIVRGLTWGSARQPELLLHYVRVHPWFLASAIHIYATEPGRRASIGTRAEYERLRLGTGGSTAP